MENYDLLKEIIQQIAENYFFHAYMVHSSHYSVQYSHGYYTYSYVLQLQVQKKTIIRIWPFPVV